MNAKKVKPPLAPVIGLVPRSWDCSDDLWEAALDRSEIVGFLLVIKSPDGKHFMRGGGDYAKPSVESVGALHMAARKEEHRFLDQEGEG